MSELDKAYPTLIVSLRPGPDGDPGTSKPIAGVIVRLNAGSTRNDKFVRVLLRQGLELVAAPLGHFAPTSNGSRGHVTCATVGKLGVTLGDLQLYDGPAPGPQKTPPGWVELAKALGAAIVYIAFTDSTLDTEDQINQVARSGHVVGAYATLDITSGWAEAYRTAIPADGE